MEETEFVPHEQAFALKELGFDEACFGYYVGLGDNKENPFKLVQIKTEKGQFEWIDNVCHAPTFSQAFRFFRKKYKLHASYGTTSDYDEKRNGFVISNYIDGVRNHVSINWEVGTYEEAELACLNKLIEITKTI